MNKDWSLLDASFGRVREGLRVIEEAARFVLRDREAFEEVKTLRHQLADLERKVGSAHLLSGRRGLDLGQEAVVEDEYDRGSIWDILRANLGRAIQSARVLEEFAKIYFRAEVLGIESLRYSLYALEKKMLTSTPHYWLRLYFERGIVYPISDSAEELIWVIERGALVVQLRDKNSSEKQVYEKAKKLCEFIKQRNSTRIAEPALLIINDYARVAASLSVAGVHIGQDFGNARQARAIVGSAKIIGKSNHSVEQMKASIKEGADYVSIGPIFSTPTKPERSPVGLDAIKEAAKEIIIPWVAIGGIDEQNIAKVRALGAKNVAVVRAARQFFKTNL